MEILHYKTPLVYNSVRAFTVLTDVARYDFAVKGQNRRTHLLVLTLLSPLMGVALG
jgi:hypothetical protein